MSQTRASFQVLRTKYAVRRASSTLLGHQPYGADRPLRRDTGRSIPARQLALSAQQQSVSVATQITRKQPFAAESEALLVRVECLDFLSSTR